MFLNCKKVFMKTQIKKWGDTVQKNNIKLTEPGVWISWLHLRAKQLCAQWMKAETWGCPTPLRRKTTQECLRMRKRLNYFFQQMFSQWEQSAKTAIATYLALFLYNKSLYTYISGYDQKQHVYGRKNKAFSNDWLTDWVLVCALSDGCSALLLSGSAPKQRNHLSEGS